MTHECRGDEALLADFVFGTFAMRMLIYLIRRRENLDIWSEKSCTATSRSRQRRQLCVPLYGKQWSTVANAIDS